MLKYRIYNFLVVIKFIQFPDYSESSPICSYGMLTAFDSLPRLTSLSHIAPGTQQVLCIEEIDS